MAAIVTLVLVVGLVVFWKEMLTLILISALALIVLGIFEVAQLLQAVTG
jgi:hypothetical protein